MMPAQQSGLYMQRRENKWLMTGRYGTDNARCIDGGRTQELMVLVAELLAEIRFSDFFYHALVHSRSVGVRGTVLNGHNELSVLFAWRFLEYDKSRR